MNVAILDNHDSRQTNIWKRQGSSHSMPVLAFGRHPAAVVPPAGRNILIKI